MNDGADETKAEIYEAWAAINRAFAQITNALYKLESSGVLPEDAAFIHELPMREMSTRINCKILTSMNERELDDRNHYGRMNVNLKKRAKK